MRLIADEVSVRFGKRLVLDALSFVADAGHYTAILGPSGIGKSTLMLLLAGAIQPSDGMVYARTEDGDRRDVRALVSWSSQAGHILTTRSVLDNAMLGALAEGKQLAAASAAARKSLALVGLTGLADALGVTLSGGEAQRLSLARALTSSRPFLFVDEPTASLDSTNTESVVMALSAARCAGKGVVVATHDPAVASAADVVFVIENGQARAR